MYRMLSGIFLLVVVVSMLFITASCENISYIINEKTNIPDKNSFEEIQKKLNDYLDKNYKDKFSGSILISAYGKVLFSKGYGMADYDNGIPNTPNTSFDIASLNKQFTAMGIMILSEKGLLNVSDKINKFIPEIDCGDKITVHQLLTNTSGITNKIYDDIPLNMEKSNNIKDIIRVLKGKKINLAYEPGRSFSYCNVNYTFLEYIIEKVSKKSYQDFITENILQPLNMDDSGFYNNEIDENHAVGYLDLNPIVVRAIDNKDIVNAQGGLYSSVEDMFKWDQALYSEKLVKQKTLEAIFKSYKGGYGYGWFIGSNNDGIVADYKGKADGFSAYIKRNIAKGQLIVILNNYENYDPEALVHDIESMLNQF